MIDIISLLSADGYIMCNKTLIRLYGADCAILVGEFCAEYNYYSAKGELVDNMFYSTQDNIELNTGLNPYSQRKALKVLQDAEIIEVVRKGVPAKNYYKINENKLCEIFITRCSNFEELEVQKLNLNNNKKKNKEKNIDISKDISTEKSEKPKKLSLYEKCVNDIIDYTDDIELQDTLVDYLKIRLANKDKPILGEGQWKGMLKKLATFKNQKEIVLASIEHGWASFYDSCNNYNDVRKPNKNVFGETNDIKSIKDKTEENLSGEKF